MKGIKKGVLTLLASFVGVIIVILVFANWDHQGNNRRTIGWTTEDQRVADQQMEEFLARIDKAKQETADPCNMKFYELVLASSGRATRLVMMGRELPYGDESLGPSFYFLKSNGDRVELWERVMNNARYGIEKVGEKYSPDSPACQGKK